VDPWICSQELLTTRPQRRSVINMDCNNFLHINYNLQAKVILPLSCSHTFKEKNDHFEEDKKLLIIKTVCLTVDIPGSWYFNYLNLIFISCDMLADKYNYVTLIHKYHTSSSKSLLCLPTT
jgi:ACT domain-containing protein